MLTLALTLLLAPATPTAASDFVAEGEAHLKAAETADDPLDAFQNAHASFDSAYLVDGDAGHLCRALLVADRALRSRQFTGDEERKSWEETRREDLDRLQQDAAEKRRANCRFDAGGKPAAARVAMIDPDGAPPPTPASAPHVTEGPAGLSGVMQVPRTASPVEVRRRRAHTAAGAILTTAGLGLLGALVGVLELERQRIAEMRVLVDTAKGNGRQFTVDEDRRFWELRDEVSRGAGAAIGVGAASIVTLATGIAVLATRKKSRPRNYAFHPHGGPQGVGAVLRLRF